RVGSQLWETNGGAPGLLHDFGPTRQASTSWWANLRDTLLFAATEDFTQPNSGMELWRSDRTPASTFMVTDINSAPSPALTLHNLLALGVPHPARRSLRRARAGRILLGRRRHPRHRPLEERRDRRRHHPRPGLRRRPGRLTGRRLHRSGLHALLPGRQPALED